MSKTSKHHVPFVTAAWLIAVPLALALAILSGAGAGTAFDGLAGMLGVFFSIYGGASIIFGVLLMLWVGSSFWRDGAAAKALNG